MYETDTLLDRLRQGEILTATKKDGHTIRCSVDVAAPHLGVLWAWDLGTGQRILMVFEDYELKEFHK